LQMVMSSQSYKCWGVNTLHI